ncbi:unnamed protein product [Durusdinium trenchii]|uniref:Uncharacterized protein n=1 Tax=Durusdinium trenchii TaxID=1381693 RepID=A0ABP0MZC7_9DINO
MITGQEEGLHCNCFCSLMSQTGLLIQRCRPEHVKLQKWRRLDQPKPLSRLQLYLQSFQSRFPGALDSDELAKNAGSFTQRVLVLPSLTKSGSPRTWR